MKRGCGCGVSSSCFFFFNDTATTEISTLSLHDALPISFEVGLARVEQLLPKIPPGVLRVAESGLRSLPDLLRVASAGAHAALVGETLMRSPDPEATLAQWKAGLQA
mgnify:CR=1 FL=1